MSTISVLFSSLGMACPVGLTAASACAAIRARINRFRESRYLDDHGRPIICSELTQLSPALLLRERVLALLCQAVANAAQGLDPSVLAKMPLFVSTSEPGRPGGVSEVFPQALEQLHAEHGLIFDAARSRTFPSGSTGGLRALADARALLMRDARIPGCLVAGVDSLVNGPTLHWLDSQDRLKRPGQSDGVIPGEAAACVIVTRRALGIDQPVAVDGLGFAQESATIASDEPLRARGLTQASRIALAEAKLSMAEVDFRLADAAGEGYSFKELTLALAQVLQVRRETVPLWLPAEALGDIGAASAVVAMVIAATAMRRGYAPGPQALCYAASPSGERAVAVLRAHAQARGAKP